MTGKKINWPLKYDLLGVKVSATTYDEALEVIVGAAMGGETACISHIPVHGLVQGSGDMRFRAMLNEFDIVAPDGQPVRLAMNLLYKTQLPDRCYGPEMMLRLCQKASEEKLGIYLYGSHPHVVEKLRSGLLSRFPSLNITGYESPPFRPLTPEEDKSTVDRINRSGASIVFLGLGCPKQDVFAYEHRHSIKAVQISVGAAFDFLSGNKKMAPVWMQRYALEWLFRLIQEPRRLWRRYLVTNPVFLVKVFLQLIGLKRSV